MPPDLALWLTLISSNYPCLDHLFMTLTVFEPLKFGCMHYKKLEKNNRKTHQPWFQKFLDQRMGVSKLSLAMFLLLSLSAWPVLQIHTTTEELLSPWLYHLKVERPLQETRPSYNCTVYSRTSVARTPLGPRKLVRDRGSSSQWGLIIAPGQEA